MTLNRKSFTLVEVIIAVSILAMGVLMSMSLLAMSSRRSIKSYDKWQEQHVMTQALEYLMLTGSDKEIPSRFFPYDDYSVSCTYSEPEDLPEEVPVKFGSWEFTTMHVELRKTGSKKTREISIDRILKVD